MHEAAGHHTRDCAICSQFISVTITPSSQSRRPGAFCLWVVSHHEEALVYKHSGCFPLWPVQTVLINIRVHMSLPRKRFC